MLQQTIYGVLKFGISYITLAYAVLYLPIQNFIHLNCALVIVDFIFMKFVYDRKKITYDNSVKISIITMIFYCITLVSLRAVEYVYSVQYLSYSASVIICLSEIKSILISLHLYTGVDLFNQVQQFLPTLRKNNNTDI